VHEKLNHPITRSEMMGKIGVKNTKPEILIRNARRARCFRYRLHDKKLAVNPDITLPKHQTVIFDHGCFWHAHEDYRNFTMPRTRPKFWRTKLLSNKAPDKVATNQLIKHGWRVLTVW
jgi:DNA mismatch endonuclease (patch repair protein)